MTDKMTVHPLKQTLMGAFSTKVAITALLIASVLVPPANAVEQEWWFDVEVILFKRNLEAVNISEKFKQSRLEQSPTDFLDLLTPYLNPDLSYLRASLPYCRTSSKLAVKTQYEKDFAFPLPVAETNNSSTPQTDIQLEQELQKSQQTGQDLAVNSDEIMVLRNHEIADNSAQHQVATTDIFADTDDSTYAAQAANVKDVSPSDLAHTLNINDAPQDNIELAQELNMAGPLIRVKYIEWQVPSELLCAYAEQIDPTFASIIALQNSMSDAIPSHQIKRVPEIINGIEWQQKRDAFLLPSSTMYMIQLYEKIKKQRDITPILHVNWRQEVKFGRENGSVFRLFAGENFAEQFDANGLPVVNDTDTLPSRLHQATEEFYIPEQELAGLTPEQQQAYLLRMNDTQTEAVTEDLFAKITAALADATPINIDRTGNPTEQTTKTAPTILKELWGLEGGISVYLRNVGRIPYLHIDSNLDFRQPVYDARKAPQLESLATTLSGQGAIMDNQLRQPDSLEPNSLQPNFLQSVNFNQLRRVISKQVHYFDHPLFGMIVRINRYRWPEVQQEEQEEQEVDVNNNGL
jgi:hypothetical protein